MKLNSFSPIPENDDELHLPELVYWASLGELAEVEIFKVTPAGQQGIKIMLCTRQK